MIRTNAYYVCLCFVNPKRKKENVHNISAFKNGLGEIKLGRDVWPKWSIWRLWNQLSKDVPWFTVNVFYSEQWKWNGLILANFGLLKALLTLKGIDRSYTIIQVIPYTLNSSTENAYNSYKNRLTHSLRVAKRLYYEKQLEKLKSNAKTTWRVLNEVLNRNKGKRGLPFILRALRFSRNFQSWGKS